MTTITEVAPDVYRISIYQSEANLQFNHFLIKDEEPLLFHTGYKATFPLMCEAVGTLMDPSQLRWIGFSHFESDECGALNRWLGIAPQAQPVCSQVGAIVTVDDFAIRPARGMTADDVLVTGKYRYRFCPTPHLPHGWDAGVLFEETNRTLLCSDLFFHVGNVEPLTESDIIERARKTLTEFQTGPLANSIAYTPQTERILRGLADLKPQTLALMHGSTFVGDGAQSLHDLNVVLREIFGK